MKKLEEIFKESFGLPINQVIPLEKGMIAIDGSPENALLFGSRIAAKEPFLVQGDINSFLISCPEGYFLVGFWGHGMNSHAFYYSRVNSWSKVFFRLPFGGAFDDNDMLAKCIPQFLREFFKFEKRLMEKDEILIAVESMGYGNYKILHSDNKTFEFNESLLTDPNFDKRFEEYLCR